ncbi:MAG TPA: hypothetical protein VKB86_15175 [Pyrinomonadaceae bacterium]|nr:hypothetical protein [Pyrinomonadaceae bacterium]
MSGNAEQKMDERLLEAIERIEATISRSTWAIEVIALAQSAQAIEGLSAGNGWKEYAGLVLKLRERARHALERNNGGNN